VTTADLRMHCPNCAFPARGRWIDPDTEEVVLPGRISAESIACSNPRCFRFSPESFPSSAPSADPSSAPVS
jgi:hypothetical protein